MSTPKILFFRGFIEKALIIEEEFFDKFKQVQSQYAEKKGT